MICKFLQLFTDRQNGFGFAEVPFSLVLLHLGVYEVVQGGAVGELDVVAVGISDKSLKK